MRKTSPFPLAALLLGGCVSAGLARPEYALPPPGGPAAPLAADPAAESAPADPDSATATALADLLRLADERNPDLLAARRGVDASAGRRWQTELWPNPRVAVRAKEVPLDDVRTSRAMKMVELSQPLAPGGRRGAAIEAAAATHAGRRHAYEALRREVLGEVRSVWVELAFLADALPVQRDVLDAARRELAAAEGRLASGSAAEPEVLPARLDHADAELEAQALERERAVLVARLTSLLGGTRLPFERMAGGLALPPPPGDAAALRRRVAESHPALLAARAESDAAASRLAEARAERLPDVEAMVAYGHRDEGERGLPGMEIVEAGVGLELPVFDRNQGRIAETAAEAALARHAAAGVEEDLLARVDSARAAYAAAARNAATLESGLVPAAERSYELVRRAHEAGSRALVESLAARRTLGRARLALLRELRAAGLASAELWSLAADLPDHHDLGDRP